MGPSRAFGSCWPKPRPLGTIAYGRTWSRNSVWRAGGIRTRTVNEGLRGGLWCQCWCWCFLWHDADRRSRGDTWLSSTGGSQNESCGSRREWLEWYPWRCGSIAVNAYGKLHPRLWGSSHPSRRYGSSSPSRVYGSSSGSNLASSHGRACIYTRGYDASAVRRSWRWGRRQGQHSSWVGGPTPQRTVIRCGMATWRCIGVSWSTTERICIA